jgi:predicted nucleic acid-binding protein
LLPAAVCIAEMCADGYGEYVSVAEVIREAREGTICGEAASRTRSRAMLIVDAGPVFASVWMEQYVDMPLGMADASLIASAERLGAHEIATLDRRHFGAVRPEHVESFTLLP